MLAPGTRLGPLEIQSLLGAGGMGEVYRARDVRLNRSVAVKILAPGGLDVDRATRLQREARLLATLSHPNIAAIHGVEEHEDRWALVLELVEGETLATRLSRGPVPVTEATRFAHQIVDALDAAHERGIVHRDLKPANIAITRDGTIKILDFGLAKAIVDREDETATPAASTLTATRAGTILGTPAYMSPEQARGLPVDKRTDIWGFGCVLFEMLSGQRPFDGDSTSDILVGVLDRDPPWSALPTSTPPGLRRLIRRCLEKDPRARLRDIADARADLRLDDAPASRTGGGGPRARALAAASLVTLVSVAAFEVWSRWPAPGVPAFVRATRIVSTTAHEFGPAISPDGKWIAYLSDARGVTDVWVKFIAGGTPVNLTASAALNVQALDYVTGVQISPDGNLIAFVAAPEGSEAGEFSSWVVPAPLGGTPRRVLPRGTQGLTWSPDGSRIAYMRVGGSAGDTVWVANADGQQPRQIVHASGGRHTHWLRWSAGGQFVYFTYGFHSLNLEPTSVFRVAASGGTPEPVVLSSRRALYPFPDAPGRGLFYAANPDTVDTTLWWRDFGSGRDHRLTNGIGEYGAPSLSTDGTRLVASVSETRSYIARIDVTTDGPATLRALSDPLSGDVDPSWSRDGTRVAFSSARGGDRNIWVARNDFSNPAPVTFGTAIDERPAFSPDGTEIAFVSDRGGRRGVWLVSLDGGTPRSLAVAEVFGNLTWSRDGRVLMCSVASGSHPNLVAIARADGRITPLKLPGTATVPSWSPRDDVIAYLESRTDGGADLRFIRPDGTPADFPLPEEAARVPGNLEIAWAPDGRRLARVAVPGSQPGTIWLIDPTPGRSRQLLQLPPATQLRGLSWTPDGSALTVGVVTRTADIMLLEGRR